MGAIVLAQGEMPRLRGRTRNGSRELEHCEATRKRPYGAANSDTASITTFGIGALGGPQLVTGIQIREHRNLMSGFIGYGSDD